MIDKLMKSQRTESNTMLAWNKTVDAVRNKDRASSRKNREGVGMVPFQP